MILCDYGRIVWLKWIYQLYILIIIQHNVRHGNASGVTSPLYTCVRPSGPIYSYNISSVNDIATCEQLCFGLLKCLFFSYLPEKKDCFLFDNTVFLTSEESDCIPGLSPQIYKLSDQICKIETVNSAVKCTSDLVQVDIPSELYFNTATPVGGCLDGTQANYVLDSQSVTIEACFSSCIRLNNEDQTQVKCVGVAFDENLNSCLIQSDRAIQAPPDNLNVYRCYPLGDTTYVNQVCDNYARFQDTCGAVYGTDSTLTCKCATLAGNSANTQCVMDNINPNTVTKKKTCTLANLQEIVNGSPASTTKQDVMLYSGIGSAAVVFLVAIYCCIRKRKRRKLLNTSRSVSKDPSHISSTFTGSHISGEALANSPTPIVYDNTRMNDDVSNNWNNIHGTKNKWKKRSTIRTQMSSFGQAFLNILGLVADSKDSIVFKYSSDICTCAKPKAVNFDKLEKEELINLCTIKELNSTGPKDALVIRLLLKEEETGVQTCKLCFRGFHKV